MLNLVSFGSYEFGMIQVFFEVPTNSYHRDSTVMQRDASIYSPQEILQTPDRLIQYFRLCSSTAAHLTG